MWETPLPSQYVNEMCQSKIGRRYLTHHWLIVFNALYSIRLALPCCHGSMVKQCAYGTCRSDTRYPARLEGHVVFFSHFQSPKHRRKGAGGGLNSVGDPPPNSIYLKTHICLLQSKLSCLQIAIYLANYAIARYDN